MYKYFQYYLPSTAGVLVAKTTTKATAIIVTIANRTIREISNPENFFFAI